MSMMIGRLTAVVALLLGVVLAAGDAQGGLVGAGSNQSGEWELFDPATSFRVTNDGDVEHRAAVEFDLRDIFVPGNTDFTATLSMRGKIETEKTLYVYAYVGNGAIEVEDLLGGTQVGEILLFPTRGVTDIEIDLSAFVDGLGDARPDYGYLGFNLRESVSTGGVVTLEYLVLGTFLDIANQQQSYAQLQRGAVPEPGSLAIWSCAIAGLAFRARQRRSAQRSV